MSTILVLFNRDLRIHDQPAPAAQRRQLGYPEPIVDHAAAATRFKRRRM